MQVNAVKFYVDASVWRDYFEDRKDNIRPLGEFAFQFLKKCIKNNFKILYSHFVVEELLHHYTKDKVELVFENYKKHMVRVEETDEIIKEAVEIKEKFSGPLVDVIHALLAKANNAILISRDKHFEELNEIVETGFPEDFI